VELIKLIHDELPQIQCGRCDTPGCYQYAEQIANGGIHDRCVPGGTKTLNNLNKILAKNITSVDMNYGPSIPLQIAIIDESECIGCKKCITACPVDAIAGSVNLMHNIIDELCTGCELCIEPCPVDCIDLVETFNKDSRVVSQVNYDATSSLRMNESKQKRMDTANHINKEIGGVINTKLENRNSDTSENLKSLQLKILNDQLDNFHNLNEDEKNTFIRNLNTED
jgi:RnfABCDGE-type electron transport complex B subunit|tara:strand:- start:1713 stop:2387 length:675 start_codon:yes stop_codon:yes gene_type:complete